MNPHYELVAERAAHRCEYCHAPEAVFNCRCEVEHVVPAVRGGADTADNWALACRACNVRKAACVEHADPAAHVPAHLYHPREDLWNDHFRVDVATGDIEGRTAIGRATISRLEMNSPAQRAARRHWFRLRLFP